MKKKLFSAFILVFLCCFMSPALDSKYKNNFLSEYFSDAEGMPTLADNKAVLDIPLVGGIVQFATLLDSFVKYFNILTVLFAFLMLIFTSFKLWFGTIEIKKAFVEVIYKCLIVMGLSLVYRPVTNSCLKLANAIGCECGGYEKINHVYTEAYKSLKDKINVGLAPIKQGIKENAFKAYDGDYAYVTEDMMNSLSSYGMTKEEIENWAKQENLLITHQEYVETGIDSVSGEKTGYNKWVDEYGNELTKPGKKSNWFSYTSTIPNLVNNDRKLNKKLKKNTKEQKQLVAKLNALMMVLTEKDLTPEDADAENSQNQSPAEILHEVFYSPWLKDSTNANTFFLSPNAIIKTCTTLSDALYYANSMDLDDMSGNWDDIELTKKAGVWTTNGIIKGIFNILYKFGMLIGCCIIMAEYSITILEFYIVRAIAVLLIPLFFLDSTKQFAQNLIRLFLSFFMKILVTVICCFFAIGLFMDTINLTLNALDIESSITMVTYITSMMLGIILANKAPQIAGTVISGQASMGVGDIARIGHSLGHAMHSASRMSHDVQNFAKGASHVGQAAARGVAGAASVLDTAQQAASFAGNRVKSAMGDGQYSVSSSDIRNAQTGAFFSSIGSAIGQKAADKAHKAVFGSERHHLDENNKNTEGFWRVGQQVLIGGQQRVATAEDVMRHNREVTERLGANAADSVLNRNMINSTKNIENDLNKKNSFDYYDSAVTDYLKPKPKEKDIPNPRDPGSW